jgi:hypothetical protein
LARSTRVFGHKVIVAFFPRRHVLWHLASEGTLSLLCHRIFIFEALLDFLETLVILLVLAEYLGVLAHVLFIGQPSLIMRVSRVLRIADVIINSANIIMVDSMLNIIKIVVGKWHTILSNFILSLDAGVGPLILYNLIFRVDDFSE